MEFSVLMTVYEKEKPYNLRKSLLTSYSQTIKPTEIVLVCDGELTQELYDEIDQIKNEIPILQVYQLDTNMGSGPASRFGVEKCNTDLIARMDSDDYSEETRFENKLKPLKKIQILLWLELIF